VFDFDVKWTPDQVSPIPTADGQVTASDPLGPSLFTALQEQTGLRLEGRKFPVDELVIDRAERSPAEN
jgi:uncharacterized protein (TIGR03435 family)